MANKSGEKNYITPAGHKKLFDEYNYLLKVERPKTTKVIAWAASNGDRSENADYIYGKKRLREIDRRMRFLGKRLDSAEVIDPAQIKSDKVQFGATVTVFLVDDDLERTYSIVGVDEIETSRGLISWRSPIGRALLGKEVEDVVRVRTPKGETEMEVLKILYVEIEIKDDINES